MSHGSNLPGIGSISTSSAKSAQEISVEEGAELEAEQLAAEQSLMDAAENGLFTPIYIMKNARKLQDKLDSRKGKDAEESKNQSGNHLIDSISKLAKSFEDSNPEMNQNALLGLKANIKDSDDAETIYEKVRKFYKDEYLADEALKFLEETTNPHTNLGKNIRKARTLLNERHQRAVCAGRNISDDACEYAKQGLGSPTSLRELYQDVTGNPKDPISMFEQLSQSFDFEKMKPILAFLLRSLGKDIKSKGPSISKIELQRLFSETRTMQAILSIYRFFLGRMPLIKDTFDRDNIQWPQNMNFELLSKMFTQYIQERYPSSDRLLNQVQELGIENYIVAQMIIFGQYKDALRGVSPKLFKSNTHRQDLLMAVVETVSELDEMLDEEDNDQDNDQDNDEDNDEDNDQDNDEDNDEENLKI